MYRPLSGPQAIRVLELEASKDRDEPIRCQLREISLPKTYQKPLEYETLSYVWGSSVGDKTIQCADGAILVTQNCEAALRQLRQKRTRRTLWIDAICMDQYSDREKATQIPLMAMIYYCCTRTIVWLGTGNEMSRAGFRLMRLMPWVFIAPKWEMIFMLNIAGHYFFPPWKIPRKFLNQIREHFLDSHDRKPN